MKAPRSTFPTGDNKYFQTKGKGGYSSCIQGKPTHPVYNVLNNCVGWSCAGFNEEHEFGYEKYHLTCNAENFIERAIACGLSISKKPVVGGIMVWQKGATLSGSDGAGHVALCYQVDNVDNPTVIWTSESGYGSSKSHWNSRRTNNNGKWGAGSGYTYRGCVCPAGYVPTKPSTPSTPVTPGAVGKFNIGDKVVVNGPLYTSSNASTPAGNISNKVTTITRRNDGSAHPYNTTGDLGWMDESSITKYNEPAPTPTPAPQPSAPEFKVGDRVAPTRLVDYNGRHLRQYDDSYTISELKGNRAVLKARGQVWAAMRTEDLKHV